MLSVIRIVRRMCKIIAVGSKRIDKCLLTGLSNSVAVYRKCPVAEADATFRA